MTRQCNVLITIGLVLGYLLPSAVLLSSCSAFKSSSLASHEQIISNVDLILDMEKAFNLTLGRFYQYGFLLNQDEVEEIAHHANIFWTYYYAAYNALTANDIATYYDTLDRIADEIESMNAILDDAEQNSGPSPTPSGTGL